LPAEFHFSLSKQTESAIHFSQFLKVKLSKQIESAIHFSQS